MHTTFSVLADLAALPSPSAVKTIPEVLAGITGWIMGIFAVVATLFLTIAALRYATAGGDPTILEQAKSNFRSALVGYALAVLAPVVLSVLQSILGG